MKNLNNHYLKKLSMNETGKNNRHNHSIKHSNLNSTKHNNYYASSEDEKNNSKSNNLKSNKKRNKINKYQINSKHNANAYSFPYSHNIFNDYGNLNNKNNNLENSSYLSNIAFNSLNSINYEDKKSNSISQNFNENSLKTEVDVKANYNLNQSFMKHKHYNTLDYNDTHNIKDYINKYNANNISNRNNNFDSSYKLNEEDSISRNYQGLKNNTINEEQDSNYKKNSNRSQNYELLSRLYYKNTSNFLNNKTDMNSNIYEDNSKEYKDNNNLSLGVKKNVLTKNNNIQNILNINKKNTITIPNNKIKNNINESIKNNYLTLHKNNELNKIKIINFTNISNLHDSSKKKKNNHSFYEIKSLSKDFPHRQTEPKISEAKKLIMKINNINNILNLSSKKYSELNINQYINNSNTKEKENIYNTKNSIIIEEKNEIIDERKDKTSKLIDLNKYLTKERQSRNISKDSKKSNSEKIKNNNENNNANYNKKNDKIVFNINKINIGNIHFQNTKNILKLKSDYIKDFTNKRKSSLIESFMKFKKYRANKVNSYSFNYIPQKKELKKNKKNKKFVSNKKLLTLMNLNYKTFEEDFPLKINIYKRYQLNKDLKPQISVRITLFSVIKPERKKKFCVNFFYSENLRKQNLVESEYEL